MQRETYSLAPGVVVEPFDAPGEGTFLISTSRHCFRVSQGVGTLLLHLATTPASVSDLALITPELHVRGKTAEQGLLFLFTSILLPAGIVVTSGTDVNVCPAPSNPRKIGITGHDPFALRLKIPLLNVSRLEPIVEVTQKLMHPALAILSLVAWLGSLPFLLSQLHAERLLTDPEQVLAHSFSLFLILILGGYVFTIWHELGHLSACRRYSVSANEFGIGIYWTSLVFYVGLNRSYALPRSARLLIDVGGITFTAHLSLLFLALYIASSSTAFLLVASMLSFDILYNLNPFLKLDGYWLLSDSLGITNLHQHVLDVFSGRQPRTRLKSWPILAYGSFLFVYLFAGAAGFFFFGIDFLTEFPAFIAEQWRGLSSGWSSGQLPTFFRSLWALVFMLMLPMLGIGSTLWHLAARVKHKRKKSSP